MNILAIESSAKVASASVLKGNNLLGEIYLDCGLVHSKTLALIVQNLLDITSFKLEDVDVLAVSNGPGSFTGVRIGVSIVKGMALVLDKPAIGISTLYAIAQNSIMLNDNLVCTVIDARNGQFYAAIFEIKNCNLFRLLEDSAISAANLFSKLCNYGNRNIVLSGDGAELFYDYINKNDISKKLNVKVMDIRYRYQSSKGVAYAARNLILSNKSAMTSIPDLQINYLKPCQAEMELSKKLKLDIS